MKWDSARFIGFFLASDLYSPKGESTPTCENCKPSNWHMEPGPHSNTPCFRFGWLIRPTLGSRKHRWRILGGGIILIALRTIRLPAARPSIHDQLVQTGIYVRVRHPIHTGALLEFAGLAMINPTLPFALASGMGMLWVFLQTWCEEIDLLERLPGYRDYMNTVPRFLPRIRIKAGVSPNA